MKSKTGAAPADVSTPMFWYNAGSFKNEDEARGAFLLAYRQGLDGMGTCTRRWMGMTAKQFDAWMCRYDVPPLNRKRPTRDLTAFYAWMDELNAEAVRRGLGGLWPMPDQIAHRPNCWIEKFEAGFSVTQVLDETGFDASDDTEPGEVDQSPDQLTVRELLDTIELFLECDLDLDKPVRVELFERDDAKIAVCSTVVTGAMMTADNSLLIEAPAEGHIRTEEVEPPNQEPGGAINVEAG